MTNPLFAQQQPKPDPIIDQPMNHDPELPQQKSIPIFSPRLRELWEWGLRRPDAETVRRSAEAIGQASVAGMTGLDALLPLLIEKLDSPGQHRLVRMAIAKALIQMNADSAASNLLAHNQADGVDVVLLTDPALASWNYEPARAVWIKRVSDHGQLRSVRLSALDSIRTAVVPAGAPLRALVVDESEDPAIRLAAARALGAVVPSGLESLSKQLAAPSGQAKADQLHLLMAAHVLATHRGDEAQKLFADLARSPEPVVAALAAQRLLAIDATLLQPLSGELLVNTDANVRRVAAQAALAWQTPAGVAAVAPLMDDPDPALRVYVRDGLIASAGAATLTSSVHAAGTIVLRGQGWRGLEQSAFLLGKTQHKDAAPRLLELLNHTRPEVRLASATALRWLAISETLPPILKHVQDLTARAVALGETEKHAYQRVKDLQEKAKAQGSAGTGKPFPPPIIARLEVRSAADTDAELAQLMQMFGQMRYQPASDLMRSYVPKHSYVWSSARGTAIWSLGYLLEDKPDQALASQLLSRMTDNNPLDPEASVVRVMSAVTIGRMKAVSFAGTFAGMYNTKQEFADLLLACRWSYQRMTGKELPMLPDMESRQSGWFLEPIE